MRTAAVLSFPLAYAANWAQISGAKETNAVIEQDTPWSRRWGHAAISQLYPPQDQAKGKLSRMYILGGDDRMQLATMKDADFRAYPGGGSFRNDVWATTGIVWNTSVNLLVHNQWGDPDPQIVAKLKWSQTNAGKIPQSGVLYTDWISCLTAAWNPYPPTGCDDPTTPPGQYIADAMFSPRRHFAALTFQNQLYIFGGRARELLPVPNDDTIGGLHGPRNVRWIEYAVLKNDVWRSNDAGVSWALVTPGCEMPHSLETYKSGSKINQCTTQRDCFGDSTCHFDKVTLTGTCMCNMWSPRELHSVVVYQDSFFLSGGYSAIQLNLCGPETNGRPSGQEYACGGLYRKFMQDIWTSSDGQKWTQLTANAAWSPRGEHAMATWQGMMWILGGRTGDSKESTPHLLNDIWNSQDGRTWNLVTKSAPWAPRAKHAVLGMEANVAANTSAYMILIYGENDDEFLGDVWTWNDPSTATTWIQDYEPGTPTTNYVTPTSLIQNMQGVNQAHIPKLKKAGIKTILDLTNVPSDVVIDLRLNQGVPVCDYIAIAKIVVAKCTISPVDYDGKEFENVKVLKGKNADAQAALDASAANVAVSTAWDGCEHRGTPVLDWVTLKYVWPEVGGIPQVDTKNPFPNAQNTFCKWKPKPRSSFAAVSHNKTVYIFGGKIDNRIFDNSAWYRDPIIPKAHFTSVPESFSHTTIFTFDANKPGVIYQYHVIDMVEKLVVRNWTNCLHELDFLSWLDGGLHQIRIRALDPAGNVEMSFEDGRNLYVWVYVPTPPWNLIIAMIVLFFVMCLGVFLEWRRRRKQAAMERYAMKRMRRKMRGKNKAGNKDTNWRETYDNAKDGTNKRAKKNLKERTSQWMQRQRNPKKYMENVAVEPENGGSVDVNRNQEVVERDPSNRPTPSPSQSRSQSQSPLNKGEIEPTGTSNGKLNGGGIALDESTTQSISRRLVSNDVTTQCPLLLGSYRVDENGVALWTGRWAMTETEYANGITSLFEMKSKPISSRMLHHNQLDPYNNMFQIENATDEDENRASPLPLDINSKHGSTIERKFDGFFQIITVKGKPATIPEKDVTLTFQTSEVDNVFVVRGTGENRFGVFTLQGILDEASHELRLYKAYKPKDKTPVAKRTRPKETSKPVETIEKTEKTPKKQRVKITSSSVPTDITASIAASITVDYAMNPYSGSAHSTPTLDRSASRNRSERKRSLPAHLREEGLAELERVPAMRKCHNILKNLVGHPKALAFLVPVDPIALGIPDYFKVIKEPMDLGTVRGNLENGVYPDPHSFAEQVRLVFNNAMRYNAAHTQVHVFAQKLLEDFEKKMKSVFKTDSAMIFAKDDEGSQDSSSGVRSKSSKSKSGKRGGASKNEEIQSLKQEIEKMKMMVHEMVSNKGTPPIGTPNNKPRHSRPFRLQDLTEEQIQKPMTAAEKFKLTDDLKLLPGEKMSRALQIIAETVPLHTITQGDDEVELDINLFDTRSLRLLEGYIREQNASKRKRPPKKATAKGSDRLQVAKESAEAIRSRQEVLQRRLAAMENGGVLPPPVDDVRTKLDGEKSSDSSSSDSGSSDSESSDSDSDGEQPLQKSPSLVSASAFHSSELSRSTVVDQDIANTVANGSLKVENRGAWTKLAQLESDVSATVQPSPIESDENASSSLWLYARTLEQQKLQKEQLKDTTHSAEDVAQQKKKELEERKKEKERERQEMERLEIEKEIELKQAREERQREMENTLAALRVEEREKLQNELKEIVVLEDGHFSQDMAQFGSASFY